MNKSKILILTACFLACWGIVGAQNVSSDELKKQIANVKKSSLYLYGEAVSTTAEEAKSLAEELLYDEINKWVASKKKLQGNAIVVNNKKDLQTALSLPRGNMFRAFVYVKKSDIIPTSNAEVIDATALPDLFASTATPVYPEAVTTIASYTDYHQMAEKIKELKAAGKISHYARYANLEKPEIYYLAIYNQQGQVVAVLTPGETRTNVKTGQADKVANYSGCGAIGFSLP